MFILSVSQLLVDRSILGHCVVKYRKAVHLLLTPDDEKGHNISNAISKLITFKGILILFDFNPLPSTKTKSTFLNPGTFVFEYFVLDMQFHLHFF